MSRATYNSAALAALYRKASQCHPESLPELQSKYELLNEVLAERLAVMEPVPVPAVSMPVVPRCLLQSYLDIYERSPGWYVHLPRVGLRSSNLVRLKRLIPAFGGILSKEQRDAVAAIPWKVVDITADTKASHRAQTYISQLVNQTDLMAYLNLLCSLQLSTSIYDRETLGQCMQAHAESFPSANILDFALHNSRDVLVASLFHATPPGSEQRKLMTYHYVRWAQQQLEMIKRLDPGYREDYTAELNRITSTTACIIELQEEDNGELLALSRLIFSQNPSKADAAYGYYKMLNLIPEAGKTEALMHEEATLCQIAYQKGNRSIAVQMGYAQLLASGRYGSVFSPLMACGLAFSLSGELREDTPIEIFKVVSDMHKKYLQDDAVVTVMLADMYSNGYGCEKNEAFAEYYDRRAADLGDMTSFSRLFPGLSLADAFDLAKADCRAAYLYIKTKAAVTNIDDIDREYAKEFLELCNQHGYGTSELMQAISGPGLFAETKRSDAGPLSARPPFDARLLSNRQQVRRFKGGFTFLNNQVNANSMLVGVKNVSYAVDAHTVHESNEGIATNVAVNAIRFHTDKYIARMEGGAEKDRWQSISGDLLQMEREYSIEQLQECLDREQMVSLSSGWSGHAITLSVFKLDGLYYLAYSNQGEGGSSSINFFHIKDITKLQDASWLSEIQSVSKEKDYMVSLDESLPGLAKDLGLERVCAIDKTLQNAGNCSLKVGYSVVLHNLLFQQIKTDRELSGYKALLTPGEVAYAEHQVKPESYKSWRLFLRQSATEVLCDLGLYAESNHIVIPPEQHFNIMLQTIEAVQAKFSTGDPVTEFARDNILQEIVDFIHDPGCHYDDRLKEAIYGKIAATSPDLVAALRFIP
ncbi:MAG: hypothetical protein P1U63_06185 [Coxiellaceae bacterium]|nr:hypothetical protein [Coxiellaceae bacterium]